MPEFKQAEIRKVRYSLKLPYLIHRKERVYPFYRKKTYLNVKHVLAPAKETIEEIWWIVYNLAKEKALGDTL